MPGPTPVPRAAMVCVLVTTQVASLRGRPPEIGGGIAALGVGGAMLASDRTRRVRGMSRVLSSRRTSLPRFPACPESCPPDGPVCRDSRHVPSLVLQTDQSAEIPGMSLVASAEPRPRHTSPGGLGRASLPASLARLLGEAHEVLTAGMNGSPRNTRRMASRALMPFFRAVET